MTPLVDAATSTGLSPAMFASLPLAAALALVALVATAAALAAGRLVGRLFGRTDDDARLPRVASATRKLVGLGVFVVVAAVLTPPALDFIGVDTDIGLGDEEVVRWASETGVRIVVLCLLAFVANRLAGAMITHAEARVVTEEADDGERRKRARTLGTTARHATAVLIWSIGALMVLRELEMDITPILTGAGILGLAIGFGAQTLVQDIISGIFLITENQLRVGDAALINGAGGIVEQINLRTVVMRDIDGTVHVIPNGEIRMLANRSKDFAWAVLDVAVSLETETDDAVEAVRAACLDLQRDPAFGLAVLAPLEVLGVDALAESGVTIRFRLKTQPLKQWEIGREWRRRVKKELDARGIRPAHPRLEVTVRNAGGGDSSAITIGR